MIIYDDDHYCMSILWTRRIYLFIEHESYSKPLVNPMEKYIIRTDSIHLTESLCYINEPFIFESRSGIIKAKEYIALSHWEFILTACFTSGIFTFIIIILIDNEVFKNTPGNRFKKRVS